MASIRPHLILNGGCRFGHALSAPFASASSSLARVRRALPQAYAHLWLSVVFLLVGLAVGVVISAQGQFQMASAAPASSPEARKLDSEMIAATISRLESEQSALRSQVADLRAQLSIAQRTGSTRKSTLVGINNEMARLRAASGLVALRGPGVVARFDDSTVRSIPENDDPVNYILHDYDLRDILNTLWAAGAEAISINGERIVSNTSLYCVGTTVICNVTRLSPPYEVSAIGDSHALSAALRNSPQMEKFNRRAQAYSLPVKIDQRQQVNVPAYSGSFTFKYAEAEK